MVDFEITKLFLQFFGYLMFIMGLAMVISKDSRKAAADLVNKNSMMTGMINLMIGIPIVLLHNKWSGDIWTITVTILGWSSVIKGFLRILHHPKLIKIREEKLSGNNLIIASWGSLIIGCIIIYGAYYA